MITPRSAPENGDRPARLAALALGAAVAGMLGSPEILSLGLGRAAALIGAAALVPAALVMAFAWLLTRVRHRRARGQGSHTGPSRTDYKSAIERAPLKPLSGDWIL
jgi:hypothetical protein